MHEFRVVDHKETIENSILEFFQPVSQPTDGRLNFHESFARRGSRYIVYRNIHIRIGLN